MQPCCHGRPSVLMHAASSALYAFHQSSPHLPILRNFVALAPGATLESCCSMRDRPSRLSDRRCDLLLPRREALASCVASFGFARPASCFTVICGPSRVLTGARHNSVTKKHRYDAGSILIAQMSRCEGDQRVAEPGMTAAVGEGCAACPERELHALETTHYCNSFSNSSTV